MCAIPAVMRKTIAHQFSAANRREGFAAKPVLKTMNIVSFKRTLRFDFFHYFESFAWNKCR